MRYVNSRLSWAYSTVLIAQLLSCDGGGPESAQKPPASRPSPAIPDAQSELGTPTPAKANSRCACEDYEQNNIQVFRRMAPATVFVTQKKLIRDFWRMRQAEVEAGTGSGFIWDQQGHIVTNFHVVSEATSLQVTLFDGSEHPAAFVGGDPTKDIAVLKINVERLKTPITHVKFPNADERLDVGQTTIAIGNPFGLDHTLTVGVVSALGREVKGFGGVTIRNMIQTDASINPGNSGGPLLDRHGRLIGMNTSIYSKVGQSSGIGFAVPTPTLLRQVPQIIAYGKPRRAGLGIELVPDALARRSGIRGIVIASVIPGGPADQAGLRGLRRGRRATLVGDIIVGIDGKPIADYDDLYNALDDHEPGDTVTVTIEREGTRKDLRIDLVLVE